jgi:hypothetical protein
LLAAAAFAAVLLLGVLIVTLSSTQGDVVDTVLPPTTVPVATTVATTSELSLGAAQFAVAYSSGDYESVRALLADGTQFGWSRISDFASGPVLWTEPEFRARYEIDTALNTTITLTECEDLDERRVSCAVLRVDDLVRAQQLEPAKDVRWRLTIEDGQVLEWTHHTPDLSRYFLDAREPFHLWLDEAHPEVEAPYVDNRGAPWRHDTNFVEIAPDLVAEYAASLGVDLGR